MAYETWISAVVYLLAIHALAGAIFATLFVTRWITRIDPAAAGSSWAVRALLWPGSVAAWPVLWHRLASARGESR